MQSKLNIQTSDVKTSTDRRLEKVIAAAFVCVLVCLIVFAFLERPQLATWLEQPSNKSSVPGNSPTQADLLRAEPIGTVISSVAKSSSPTEKRKLVNAVGNSSGIYSESARTLIRSGSAGKIDYGIYRLRTECLSLVLGGDGVKLVNEFSPAAARANGQSELLIGAASNEVRLIAFARSAARCNDFYEGALLSSEEVERAKALPAFARYQAIAKTLSSANNFDSPEVRKKWSPSLRQKASRVKVDCPGFEGVALGL
jgi:hypothetical protein